MTDPIVLVDVGARGGLPVHWQKLSDRLDVIGFEPDVDEWRRLVTEEPEKRFFNTAMSREPGTLPLYCTRYPGLTSVFPPNRALLDQFPNSELWDVVDQRQVPADTLDNVIAANALPPIDVLKIDTQGSELHILEGAINTLESVLCVEVEVEYLSMYVGQPLHSDVDRFLRPFGFVLAWVKTHEWIRTHDQERCVVWADFVYLKHGQTSEKAQAIAKVFGL